MNKKTGCFFLHQISHPSGRADFATSVSSPGTCSNLLHRLIQSLTAVTNFTCEKAGPGRSRYCFRGDRQSGAGRPDVKVVEEDQSEPEKSICCKFCGFPVTTRDQKISVGSSHTHTFFNPAGIVFELGCFKAAPGCLVSGDPTSEFTWFAGYLWNFSHCRNCRAHLGWFYQQEERNFFGLILTKLKG